MRATPPPLWFTPPRFIEGMGTVASSSSSVSSISSAMGCGVSLGGGGGASSDDGDVGPGDRRVARGVGDAACAFFARDGDGEGSVALFLGDFLAAGDTSGAAAVTLEARLVERPVVMATTFSEVSTAPASVLLRFAAAGFSAATGAADAALLRRLDVRVPAGTSGSSDGVEAVFATACRHEVCAR